MILHLFYVKNLCLSSLIVSSFRFLSIEPIPPEFVHFPASVPAERWSSASARKKKRSFHHHRSESKRTVPGSTIPTSGESVIGAFGGRSNWNDVGPTGANSPERRMERRDVTFIVFSETYHCQCAAQDVWNDFYPNVDSPRRKQRSIDHWWVLLGDEWRWMKATRVAKHRRLGIRS